MDLIPNLNSLILLRDHADRDYPSRVEHVGAGLLVVERPQRLPAGESFPLGTVLGVVWDDSDGVTMVLPTQILAAYAEGTMQLWSLIVTGKAFTQQRRRSVRAPASGPVAIRSTAGEDVVMDGSLIDVSEGAVHCTVAAGAADRFLMGSNEVVAEFRFGSVDFALPGHVEFLRPTSKPVQFEEVVVIFDTPVEDVEALREQIDAQQEQMAPAEDSGNA